jgi:FMN phosphatase YigB (HAD superfamily)
LGPKVEVAAPTFAAFFEEVYGYFAGSEAWGVYPDAMPLLDDLRHQGWNIGCTARLCFVMCIFWIIRVLPVYTAHLNLYMPIYSFIFWNIGVLSNFDTRLMRILECLELTDKVDWVVLPCHSGALKPDRAAFAAALKAAGATQDCVCIHVGDRSLLTLIRTAFTSVIGRP